MLNVVCAAKGIFEVGLLVFEGSSFVEVFSEKRL